MIHLRSSDEIDAMARGGTIIAGLLEAIQSEVRPGLSTKDLDVFCDEFIVSHEGAVPAFKGLYGFPGSVCVSVNEEVVHGIPDARRILAEGDIVTVDVGVRLDGWCSDSAWTFRVGEVAPETEALLDVTERSLYAAIDAAVAGNHIGDLGAAVMAEVNEKKYGIIRDLVGHGIGRDVHEDPQVPNVGRAGHGPLLREGMVLVPYTTLFRSHPGRRVDRGHRGSHALGPLRAHRGHHRGGSESSHRGARPRGCHARGRLKGSVTVVIL